MAEDLIAREGDVLVVSYPEVKVPIKPYWTVGVGGLIYTRKLNEGESVREQHSQIYAMLTRMAEHDASEKIATWAREANGSPPPKPDLPPKPMSGRPVAR